MRASVDIENLKIFFISISLLLFQLTCPITLSLPLLQPNRDQFVAKLSPFCFNGFSLKMVQVLKPPLLDSTSYGLKKAWFFLRFRWMSVRNGLWNVLTMISM